MRLKNYFQSEDNTGSKLARMLQCVQQERQSVREYAAYKQESFHTLQLREEEKIRFFLEGLKPHLLRVDENSIRVVTR